MGLDMGIAGTTSFVAGQDAFDAKWFQTSKHWRRVSRIALAGSAVIGDVKYSLRYGERVIAELYPSTVGAIGPDDDDMKPITSKRLCPANTPIQLICSGPAVTNNVYYIVEIQEFPRMTSFKGRSRSAAGVGRFAGSFVSSAVNLNVLRNASYAVSDRARRVVGVCLSGGAAFRDAALNVFFGSEQVMHLENFSTAAPNRLCWLWHTSKLTLDANVALTAIVSDAFSSTATFVEFDLVEA